jgi:membrane-associated phospholipid phosphatase
LLHLYDWFGLNVALFHWINGVHAAWWDELMLTMTWLGDHERYPAYMAVALLVACARRPWLRQRNVAAFGIGYAVTASIIQLLKPYLDFPRPLLALGQGVVVVGPPELYHSFPSGHATFAVLLAASLSPRVAKPARWALWLYAALVCLSRVSVGAHFPADVAGGALIALTAVGIVFLVLHVLQNVDPHARLSEWQR